MNAFVVAFKKVMAPYRFKVIRSIVHEKSVHVLDVGCGNDSCQLTRYWLNAVEYHGVDKEFWNDKRDDYDSMDKVYFLDLDADDLSSIPDGRFDVVVMSHVIEHLKFGEDVLLKVLAKLAPGGVIYLETPSFRTVNFPSAEGFLNFYDDSTHKRIYDPSLIADIFMKQGLKVLRAGFRRDWVRLILLSPVSLLINLFYYLPFKRRFLATGLWDLLGVACFVVATKQ